MKSQECLWITHSLTLFAFGWLRIPARLVRTHSSEFEATIFPKISKLQEFRQDRRIPKKDSVNPGKNEFGLLGARLFFYIFFFTKTEA